MKLKTLLEQHHQNKHPQQIKNNFGDAYLLQNNCVFNAVRNKVLAICFTYSNSFNADYTVFGMSQLESILKSKTIPYLDNVTLLEDLEKSQPLQIDWSHLENNLRPNYVFHESCHAYARSICDELNLRSLYSNQKEIMILVSLIEESFANTCEFMASAYAKDTVHKIFLQLNSYYVDFENVTTLNNAIKTHPVQSVFQMMLFSYLHSNFLSEKINESTFDQIMQMAFNGLPPKDNQQIKILRSLSKKAFDLNPVFRYSTTEFYLRMTGVTQPLEKALDYDFFDLIKKNIKIQKLIAQLSTSLFQAS